MDVILNDDILEIIFDKSETWFVNEEGFSVQLTYYQQKVC